MAADRVGDAVVAHVHHNKKVAAPDGLLIASLGLSRTEAGAGAFYKIRILGVFLKINIVSVLIVGGVTEFYQVLG